MKKTSIPKINKLVKLGSTTYFSILLIFLLIILIITTYLSVFRNKIYPNIYIGDINTTFLTKAQTNQLVSYNFNQRIHQPLKLSASGKTFNIDLSAAKVEISYNQAIEEAFAVGHQGTWQTKITDQFLLFFDKNNFPRLNSKKIIHPAVTFNLDKQLAEISKQVYEPAQDATVWLNENNEIHITAGQKGQELDHEQLKVKIFDYLVFGKKESTLPLKITAPNFTEKQAKLAQKALEQVKTKPLELTYEKETWTINVPTLYYLLNLDQNSESLLDDDKVASYLNDIATKIDQPVEEPLFKFNNSSSRVEAFRPAQEGKALNLKETASLINSALQSQTTKTVSLPVNVVKPTIQTAEINRLGINELIGQGVSNFAGSIENRIFNVKHTAAKINGVLIPPIETFSFNHTVGDISAATGFKQAYVIKSGRTVLDDGGGVCQVSTTLFRAALNAGLPITDRTAHAYRVSYYEQGGFAPGMDATIFHPTVDFKFKNDTTSYILIQSYVQGTTLYVDFYGTSDGRVASITKPVITSQTPPPPELRQDDPTLPRGQVKQVDWAAWGAKVSFNRTVTKNGEVIANETWRSNYKPWQAVYLVGTQ